MSQCLPDIHRTKVKSGGRFFLPLSCCDDYYDSIASNGKETTVYSRVLMEAMVQIMPLSLGGMMPVKL